MQDLETRQFKQYHAWTLTHKPFVTYPPPPERLATLECRVDGEFGEGQGQLAPLRDFGNAHGSVGESRTPHASGSPRNIKKKSLSSFVLAAILALLVLDAGVSAAECTTAVGERHHVKCAASIMLCCGGTAPQLTEPATRPLLRQPSRTRWNHSSENLSSISSNTCNQERLSYPVQLSSPLTWTSAFIPFLSQTYQVWTFISLHHSQSVAHPSIMNGDGFSRGRCPRHFVGDGASLTDIGSRGRPQARLRCEF